mmetsp:Transcript_38472/g.34226  ORF Transcript_38472/g.34226 Transcript_38472/m.34226 type:complete len:314 (-) Transcript_38472:248-1189(-)
MSLFVFSSANKIAQGIIRRLNASGQYEKIVCADLYPNYHSHESYLRGLDDSIANSKIIQDIKIHDRPELNAHIRDASHVLYITHDYFQLTPSKLNLIRTVAEYAQKAKVKKFVALTPIELDHQGEPQPVFDAAESEKAAREACPDMIHLKSDLTFGPNSSAVDFLIRGSLMNKPLDINIVSQTGKPIHSENVADVVERVLSEDGHAGKQYAVEGPESINLNTYLNKVGDWSKTSFKYGKDWFDLGFNADHVNAQVKNTCQFLNSYKGVDAPGFEDISSFNLNLRDIYSDHGELDRNQYPSKGPFERYIKNLLY